MYRYQVNVSKMILVRGFMHTFNFLDFSYFSLSLCPFKELLAAKNTYLNSFGLIGSFQNANQVTVLSCLISFHLTEAKVATTHRYYGSRQLK